jgi:hypothetical protein
MYPTAQIKFWAKPDFSLGVWSTNPPEGWAYYLVTNGLAARSNYAQKTLANPRVEDLTYVVMQVICRKYPSDPGNLPQGIHWGQDQTYQLISLGNQVDLKAVCGDRADGVISAWAIQFGPTRAANKNEAFMHQLMADALSWMMSPWRDGDFDLKILLPSRIIIWAESLTMADSSSATVEWLAGLRPQPTG